LQRIRNAFAHATKPIDFNTLEIQAACDMLETMEIFPEYQNRRKYPKRDFPWSLHKDKYTTALRIYVDQLFRYYVEVREGKTDIKGGFITHLFTRTAPLP
jgi:hypothetical protein